MSEKINIGGENRISARYGNLEAAARIMSKRYRREVEAYCYQRLRRYSNVKTIEDNREYYLFWVNMHLFCGMLKEFHALLP